MIVDKLKDRDSSNPEQSSSTLEMNDVAVPPTNEPLPQASARQGSETKTTGEGGMGGTRGGKHIRENTYRPSIFFNITRNITHNKAPQRYLKQDYEDIREIHAQTM